LKPPILHLAGLVGNLSAEARNDAGAIDSGQKGQQDLRPFGM